MIFTFFVFRSRQKEIKAKKLVSKQKDELEHSREEIKTQAEELKTINEQLVELDNFKEQMSSMLVHDIKNPLTSIIGFSAIKEINNEQKKTIHQAGLQILGMVTNMLDVYKYEKTGLQLKLENFDIKEVIDEAKNHVFYLAEQKNRGSSKIIADLPTFS